MLPADLEFRYSPPVRILIICGFCFLEKISPIINILSKYDADTTSKTTTRGGRRSGPWPWAGPRRRHDHDASQPNQCIRPVVIGTTCFGQLSKYRLGVVLFGISGLWSIPCGNASVDSQPTETKRHVHVPRAGQRHPWRRCSGDCKLFLRYSSVRFLVDYYFPYLIVPNTSSFTPFHTQTHFRP